MRLSPGKVYLHFPSPAHFLCAVRRKKHSSHRRAPVANGSRTAVPAAETANRPKPFSPISASPSKAKGESRQEDKRTIKPQARSSFSVIPTFARFPALPRRPNARRRQANRFCKLVYVQTNMARLRQSGKARHAGSCLRACAFFACRPRSTPHESLPASANSSVLLMIQGSTRNENVYCSASSR